MLGAIDESAFELAVKEVAAYRPSLSEKDIRRILTNYFQSNGDLAAEAETTQDVVIAYQKALRVKYG